MKQLLEEYLVFLIGIAAIVLIVFSLIGYNFYWKSKELEAYYVCLKMNDEILKTNPSKIGTHYCRL